MRTIRTTAAKRALYRLVIASQGKVLTSSLSPAVPNYAPVCRFVLAVIFNLCRKRWDFPGDSDSVRNAHLAIPGSEPTKARTDDLRPHRVLRPGHVGGMAAACSRCIILAAAVRLTFVRNRESAAGVFRWSTHARTKEIVEGLQNSLCLLSRLAPCGVPPEPLASAGKWRRHFQSCQWSLPNESLLFARDPHCVQAD